MNSATQMLGLTVKGALRLGQTGRVLAGTGVGWLLGDRPPTPRLVRQTFERLGATYVKLGQFIASSPSMFPDAWVTEFQHCLDRTAPLPWRTVHRALREELGRKLESEFLWVDPEPLASASIAQVHAARLKTGEDVVLKVRKPGVEKIIVTDLNLLHLVARVAEKVTPGAAHASLAAIVEEIQGSMLEECDFLKEAANIEAFRQYLDDTFNTRAVAPRVHPALSTARVLTMERFFGASLTDPAALRRCTDDPEELLVDALNTWFGSLMHCRTFHADLHAGNLMALRDGRIGFIDFGIVGRLGKKERRFLAEILYGFIRRDYLRVAEVHFEAGYVPPIHDVHAFAQAIRAIGEPIHGQPAETISMARLLALLFEVTEIFDMQARPELVLLQKTMVVVEGVARNLNPSFNMWKAAEPVVGDWIQGNLGPRGFLEDTRDGALALVSLARQAPELAARAERLSREIDTMAEKGLRFDDETAEAIGKSEARHSRSGRIALWVIAATLIWIALQMG